MSPEEYKRLFECTFEPDSRSVELHAAIKKYRKDSANVNTLKALAMRIELKEFAYSLGFTHSEFIQIQHEVIDSDGHK